MNPVTWLALPLIVLGGVRAGGAEVPVGPVAAVTASPAQRLSVAARQALARVRTTAYAHRTDIDAASGAFVTDCSGLLAWLLRRELPGHLAVIPITHGRQRPLAADFQEAFAAGVKGWRLVPLLRDAHAGDVIAWRHAELKPGASTGHVVIMDGDAVLQEDGILAVPVIDSTTTPHDDDTRNGTDGVGRGVIRFRVDGRGVPEAVSARVTAPFRAYHIVIARPVE